MGGDAKTSLKKDRYSTYDDQFQWFLFPGLLLLLLEFVIFEKRGKIDDQLVLFKWYTRLKNIYAPYF